MSAVSNRIFSKVLGIWEALLGTLGAAHVVSPSEIPAVMTGTTIVNLTTTRQRFPIPSGAKWVNVVFSDIGTTAVDGQYLKVVFGTQQDPLTTTEADARLSTTGAHIGVGYGIPVVPSFAEGNLCTTVDVISAVAVGSGKNLVTIVAGV